MMVPKSGSTDKYRVKIQGIEDYQALVACRAACPLGTDTKGYAKAIKDGDYQRAYLLARQTNPLVSVCSRVCQAPCEDACRKGDSEGAVAIRALKRFVCDREGVRKVGDLAQELEQLCPGEDDKRDSTVNDVLGLLRLAEVGKKRKEDPEGTVAIIGSGPAGLSAAHDLALLGYRVTILEAGPAPGGMLRNGIPSFRLPRELLQEEIEAILELGVELKLNAPIGQEKTLTDLRQEGYQAIFLAIGLQAPMALSLEGSELKGVHNGITYLREYEAIPVGNTCIVVGGGGVAIDCAQLALRQGAGKVMVVSLESWEQMPAGVHEKEDAHEEGISFYPCLGPKEIKGKDGRVTGLELLEVESLFDDKGSFDPRFRPHTETFLDADTVLLAVGQGSALSDLIGDEEIEATPGGRIRVEENLGSSIPGVFAGGDIAGRGQNAVQAIADGQLAARSIHEYLSGKKLRVRKKGFMTLLKPGYENTLQEWIRPARSPKRSVKERITSHQEIELPYDEEQARQQAARCAQCNVQTVFDRTLCILCGTCVNTCVRNALKMVRLEDIEGDAQVEKLIGHLAEKSPEVRSRTAIIKEETRCVRCGACAQRCPTGALTMEAFHSEEEWVHE